MSASFKYQWQNEAKDAKLGVTDFAVACYLCIKANADGTSIYPGEDTVANGLGVSRSTVTRSTARLREKGWIVLVRKGYKGSGGKGRASEYRLAIPDVHAAPVTHGDDAVDASSESVYASSERVHAALVHSPCSTSDSPPVPNQSTTKELPGPTSTDPYDVWAEAEALPPLAVDDGEGDREDCPSPDDAPSFDDEEEGNGEELDDYKPLRFTRGRPKPKEQEPAEPVQRGRAYRNLN